MDKSREDALRYYHNKVTIPMILNQRPSISYTYGVEIALEWYNAELAELEYQITGDQTGKDALDIVYNKMAIINEKIESKKKRYEITSFPSFHGTPVYADTKISAYHMGIKRELEGGVVEIKDRKTGEYWAYGSWKRDFILGNINIISNTNIISKFINYIKNKFSNEV